MVYSLLSEVPVAGKDSLQLKAYQSYLVASAIGNPSDYPPMGVRSGGREFVLQSQMRSPSWKFPQHKDGKRPKPQQFVAAAKTLPAYLHPDALR